MHSIVSSVESVKNEVDGFVKELLDKNEWDIIVPILRKGRFVLLNTVQEYSTKIRLPPFYGLDNIDEKRVLIIDDKALHGHKMGEVYAKVLSAGALKKNIKTAVFVKSMLCEQSVDYYCHELANSEYDKKESDLSLYYMSLCSQLDADHLTARSIVIGNSLDTQVGKRFPKAIEQCASDLGIFYSQDSIASLWGREKFCIADIPLSRLNIGRMEQLVAEEGVQKMRFCLEPCGELLIVPIFYPQINLDKSLCREALEGRTRFCEQISEEAPRTSELCRECIDFNLQTCALRSGLCSVAEKLRKAEYVIQIKSLSWPEFEYKYPNFCAILEQQVKEVSVA